MTAWVDASHRTPRLVLTWPALDGWADEASYAFEQVLAHGSHAQRVVAEYLGADTRDAIVAAIRTIRVRDGETPAMDTRTWSRTIGRGFSTGDLDDVDWVVVCTDEVRGGGYTHSYGDRSDEASWAVSLADFADPACVHRTIVASCLPRIDGYLRLAGPLETR